jgi:predicted dehydrogenase
MPDPLRIGIVGTGMIAAVVADAIRPLPGVVLAAAASRTRATAEAFAKKFGNARVFDSYAEMFRSGAVDAVYIAAPTAFKEEIAIAAANAGLHVLADKPFVDAASVERMIAACRKTGRAFMDATHFTHHPRTRALKEAIARLIGKPMVVTTAYLFPIIEKTNIRFDPVKEPAGALGDLCWYCMRAIVEYMPDATEVEHAVVQIRRMETGAILGGSGALRFKNGTSSSFNFGFDSSVCVQDLSIFGPEGLIQVDDYVLDLASSFVYANPGHKLGFWHRKGMMAPGGDTFHEVPNPTPQATLMVANFAELAKDPAGKAAEAAMTRALHTQRLLDAVWRAA